MNVMNVICMLTILDKTTKGVFGKRTTLQFKQILSKICSDGVDVTDDESELHALKFYGKGILLATLLGILFRIRIPSFDDLFWGEEDFLAVVLSFRGRNTHGENCWSSFCVHSSKEHFAFISKFWSKNSFKTFFLVSKVIFTRKNVILQNRIKQELQTTGHKAQILLIEW